MVEMKLIVIASLFSAIAAKSILTGQLRYSREIHSSSETRKTCIEDQQTPHEKKCNLYYRCVYGVLVAKECPDGMLFNTQISNCDSSYNVACGNLETDDNNDKYYGDSSDDYSIGGLITSNHTQERNGISLECPEKQDPYEPNVLLPHEELCNFFYKCFEGIKYPMKCPGIFQFNPKVSACDWPMNVRCVDRRQSNSEGETIKVQSEAISSRINSNDSESVNSSDDSEEDAKADSFTNERVTAVVLTNSKSDLPNHTETIHALSNESNSSREGLANFEVSSTESNSAPGISNTSESTSDGETKLRTNFEDADLTESEAAILHMRVVIPGSEETRKAIAEPKMRRKRCTCREKRTKKGVTGEALTSDYTENGEEMRRKRSDDQELAKEDSCDCDQQNDDDSSASGNPRSADSNDTFSHSTTRTGDTAPIDDAVTEPTDETDTESRADGSSDSDGRRENFMFPSFEIYSRKLRSISPENTSIEYGLPIVRKKRKNCKGCRGSDDGPKFRTPVTSNELTKVADKNRSRTDSDASENMDNEFEQHN